VDASVVPAPTVELLGFAATEVLPHAE